MEGKPEKAKKNVAGEETYSDDTDDGWENSDDEEMETRVDSLKSNIAMSRAAPIPKSERTLMTVSQIGRSVEDRCFKDPYVEAYFSRYYSSMQGKEKEKEKEKEKGTSPSSSKIRKRSAWADDPPNMQNQMLVTSSVKCNNCAHIISQGSRLHCTDLTHPLREGYPTKHYVKCPYCSFEIVMETVEGESGFESLVGATKYSGPIDKGNIVITSSKWACGYESRIKKLP